LQHGYTIEAAAPGGGLGLQLCDFDASMLDWDTSEERLNQPSAHAQGVRTDPTEAAEFVAQTGVVTIVARDAQRERLILEWGLRYEEPETA
jgi:hypothetical protein